MRSALFVGVVASALGVCAERGFAHACCLPDGTCINTTQEDCLAQGGVYYSTLFCGDQSLTCGQETGCRVTGGGVDTFGNWDGTLCDGHKGRGITADRYTFGGQAGAPTGAQPQPYGEWTHHQQSGPDGSFVFHAGTSSAPEDTEIDSITCSDPGACQPANPGPCKQIDFDGVGIFRNINSTAAALQGVVAGVTLHWFEVHIEDLGEPGSNNRQKNPGRNCPDEGSAGGSADCSCPDFYRIRIHANTDPASAVIYEVWGYLDGGNLQIHPSLD